MGVNGRNPSRLPVNTIRTYPFEVLLDKPQITPNILRAEILLSVNATQEKFGNLDNVTSVALIDYAQNGQSQTFTTEGILAIKEFSYVPNNSILINNYNVYLEEFAQVSFKTKNIGVYNGSYQVQYSLPLTWIEPYNVNMTSFLEQTYLVTLVDVKSDCYKNYYDQTIVINSDTFDGDVYLCTHTINTFGRAYQDVSNEVTPVNKDNATNGVRVTRRFLVESPYNANARWVDDSLIESAYYPKTPALGEFGYLKRIKRDQSINVIKYTKDFNILNDVKEYRMNDLLKEYNYRFPFRIIRSLQNVRDSRINFLRKFRINDYYEMPKNRGFATNLIGGKKLIYIHFENSLFRTKAKGRMLSSEGTIYTGEGDIFSVEPEEVLHDIWGQLGTQHKWSCLLTKFGYLFYDERKKKWYLAAESGSIVEISNKGLYRFFREQDNYIDLPFERMGIMSAYDEEYERFIITRKAKELPENRKHLFKGVYEKLTTSQKSLLKNGDIVIKDGLYQTVKLP